MEKNKLMMIVIIALLVILLGSVAAVSFFAFRMLNEDPKTAEEVVEDPILDVANIQLFSISEVISTNLKVGPDGSNSHVIRAGITIGVNNSDEKDKEYVSLVELIPAKEDIISSLALNKMRTKTYEELTVSDGQALLEEEILAVLQETFNTHLIVKVYVTEMILQ